MKYCVDTNIIIDILRGKFGIREKLKDIMKDFPAYTTSITSYELYNGCFNSKNREVSIKTTENFLAMTECLSFDVESSKIAGEVSSFMKKSGRTIGDPDIMIAAICIRNNATLVTSNKKHFENIPGLKLEVV